MILLAYIIIGHPDWSDSEISVYAAMPEKVLDEQKKFLEDLIQEGRIPISKSNITILPFPTHRAYEDLVHTYSVEADLVIVGFTPRQFNKYGYKVFPRFPKLRDVVFVTAEEDEISLVELETDESIDEHEMEEMEKTPPETTDSVVTNLDKSEAEPQIEKEETPPQQKEETKPPQKVSDPKDETEIRMNTKMGIKTISPKEDVDSNVKTSKIDTDTEKNNDD